MATSGSKSVKVTSYNTLTFSWNVSSQSISNNTTTVSWKMQLVAGSSGKITSNLNTKKWSVTVNGTKYSGQNNIGIANNATKTLASGTTTIAHNADGTKTFSYSFKQEFNITFSGESIGTKSGNGTGVLDAILRQATITQATNFNDSANPYITYSNPAGNAVTSLEACISLDGSNDDISYRSISKTGDTYTFNLTEAERNVLRNATTTSKSRTVRFYVRTTIGETKYSSYLTKTFTVDNAMPTMSPTVVDTDAATIALTGNTATFVKGYSDAKFTVTANALKGATIKSYKVTCGDGKSSTASTGTFSNVESGSFTFSVTDSRGYTTSQTLSKTLINYTKPTCDLSATAPTTSGNMSLNISGNYFNGSFGSVSNTLTVKYRYKTNSGSYGSWTEVTANISGNTYSASVSLTGLDYLNSYTVQAKAKDKLITIKSAEKTVKSTPVFDWGSSDFKHNTDVIISDHKAIYGIRQDGTKVKAFEPCNSTDNTSLGYGGYISGIGATSVYGNEVRLFSKNKLMINDREYGANKILWQSPGWYMNDQQTANLSEPISAQPNGIVIVFSFYKDGVAEDASVCSFFVSKKEVELMPNAGHSFFLLINSGFSVMGAKYLTINDTSLTGSGTNAANGTNNNMTFKNTSFVMRYVIGV